MLIFMDIGLFVGLLTMLFIDDDNPWATWLLGVAFATAPIAGMPVVPGRLRTLMPSSFDHLGWGMVQQTSCYCGTALL